MSRCDKRLKARVSAGSPKKKKRGKKTKKTHRTHASLCTHEQSGKERGRWEAKKGKWDGETPPAFS